MINIEYAATEATKALLDYCFKNYPIKEIRAYTSALNPYSASVAEKVGMLYSGIEKHPVFGNEGKVYLIEKAGR